MHNAAGYLRQHQSCFGYTDQKYLKNFNIFLLHIYKGSPFSQGYKYAYPASSPLKEAFQKHLC